MATEGQTNGQKRSGFAFDRLNEIVTNAIYSRAQLFRQLSDPRRDIDDECGYPKSPNPQIYQDLYDRDAIAARVVEVLPRESWQVLPIVYEAESGKVATEFEQAFDALGRSLRPEKSYHDDTSGSLIWDTLLRADIMSGIGHYGVVLLGLDDGLDLSLPVEGWNETNDGGVYNLSVNKAKTKGRKLKYLRCFPESQAQVTQFESNWSSPRYGQPVMYQVTLNDPRETYMGGVGLSMATKNVHWSRVIHIADSTRGGNDTFAVPRMRPVLNRLLDLQKLYGGDAEGFWKGVIMRTFFESHPQLGGDVDFDREALRDMMENMENGVQRWAILGGMSAKTVAPSVVDPTSHIAVQVEAICINLGIPIRVFKGSERGELASSQDDAAWNDRLKARENLYNTPRIVVPFIDRLIGVGVLPQPKQYYVEWPDMTSQTEAEKATVAATKTQALATYIGGSVENMVPPHDYLTRIMGMDDEEAKSIIDNAAKALEEKDAEHQAIADEQGLEPAPPPGFTKPEPPEQEQPAANRKLLEPADMATMDAIKEQYEELRKILQGGGVLNANPEGCNQHTGPGCGEGGTVEFEATVEGVQAAVGSYDSFDYYGLRVHHDGDWNKVEATVGAELPSSFAWDDGNQTDEQLEGTSVIGFKPNDKASVQRALKTIQRYPGGTLVVVGSNTWRGNGQDLDEVVLRNPTVIGVLNK